MAGSRRDDGPGGRGSRVDRVGAGFVALVALSGGTMAAGADASPLVVGLAALGGAVVGGALLWYLARVAR